PPAQGGAEAYFARLGRYLVGRGDQVTVFTTTAVDLEAFWTTRGRRLRPGRRVEDGVQVRRCHLWHVPVLHTAVLKALSRLTPLRWRVWLTGSTPVAPRMWLDTRPAGPFDLVHATAFPYGWPLACARRLARRLGVPF